MSTQATVVIGKDREIKNYKKLASKSKKRFIFLGEQKDADRFYQGSDVFLFPTLYEPFSNATLEAMAYECATFTTSSNGVFEIIDEEFFRVDMDDLGLCAIRVEALLKDEEKLKHYQQEHSKIAKALTVEKNLEESIKVIGECSY